MIEMEPVQVWESGSVKRTLTDVEAAARFLLEKWPSVVEGTPLHRAARMVALDAVQGNAPAEDFRAAFIAAATEAEILAPADPKPEKLLPGHIAEPWRYGKRKQRR
ncbi:MAG: hypothetical protein K0S00_3087 [Xanthobacteraceae bacterium]|jgi:hypothetical protein|nr:hypothetical protein [Xanthobacteraceae bacterium]